MGRKRDFMKTNLRRNEVCDDGAGQEKDQN